MFYKPEFRKTIRARRKQLESHAIMKAALQVAVQLIHFTPFLDAEHIGYYVADEGEVDPVIIAHTMHLLGKKLYLPVMRKEREIAFYPHAWGGTLQVNTMGIQEPTTQEVSPVSFEKLDVIFVPIVGFDVRCHRLGRGAGCYDRFLQPALTKPREQRAVLIGLAYEFQKIGLIEAEAWDVPMDYVVTEKALYERIAR